MFSSRSGAPCRRSCTDTRSPSGCRARTAPSTGASGSPPHGWGPRCGGRHSRRYRKRRGRRTRAASRSSRSAACEHPSWESTEIVGTTPAATTAPTPMNGTAGAETGGFDEASTSRGGAAAGPGGGPDPTGASAAVGGGALSGSPRSPSRTGSTASATASETEAISLHVGSADTSVRTAASAWSRASSIRADRTVPRLSNVIARVSAESEANGS